jgi:transcriptional regulator with XRE-family HTH domain
MSNDVPTACEQRKRITVNPKKVRELSGLTQEQIARAMELTLNGWQRKEQFNTEIRIPLKITEKRMAEILRFANANKKSVSEIVSEIVEQNTRELHKELT